MHVRAARPADLEPLAVLHVAGWQHGYRGLLPADVLDPLRPEQRHSRWRATLADQRLPHHGTFVAEDDGTLAGFVHLGPERDPADSGTGQVYSFYVDPARWRQGIGRALMTAAVDSLSAAGYRGAVLWVLDTNAAAIAFYAALGWRPDGGRQPDTIGEVEIHELRLRRGLPAPASSGSGV